ncbi:MAG TPA: SCO family protein [Mucilaginibacter sp.]|jgi:protein SCO1/2
MKKLMSAVVVMLLLNACKSNNNKTLPVLGNKKVVTKIVNGQSMTDTVYQTIPPIHYINQYGDSVSNKNLDGNIYVADFFFTTCPSICPIMQRNMLNVYNAFKDSTGFKIISYTIDPQHDSVPVLKKYADKLGISGNTWWLLQGRKDETYRIAKSYLVSVEEKNPAGEYIHDGFFILIDKQKRIRGTYDGTKPDDVSKLIEDIKILKSEPAS